MKNWLIAILIILVVVFIRACDGQPRTTITEEVQHDTIFVDRPVYDTIIKENQRLIRVPVEQFCDISEDDSMYILEAETKHYKDSTYEAWVSGIDPALDSIRVFNKTIIRTVTREQPVYIRVATPIVKPLHLGGFISATSSFDINYFNAQAGLELTKNKFSVKAGYNIGEHSYPFVGIEYKPF